MDRAELQKAADAFAEAARAVGEAMQQAADAITKAFSDPAVQSALKNLHEEMQRLRPNRRPTAAEMREIRRTFPYKRLPEDASEIRIHPYTRDALLALFSMPSIPISVSMNTLMGTPVRICLGVPAGVLRYRFDNKPDHNEVLWQ